MIPHRLLQFLARAALIIATEGSLFSQTPSARDLLARFCDLDAQGEQLAPGGWQAVAALFAKPGVPRREKITVVRSLVISDPDFEKGKAQFYVEYVQLGRIDPSRAVFSTLPPVKVRASFTVEIRSDVSSGRAEEPADWRIAGPVPEPHLVVDAAIRYATLLGADATDPAVKQNADKSVAALKRFR